MNSSRRVVLPMARPRRLALWCAIAVFAVGMPVMWFMRASWWGWWPSLWGYSAYFTLLGAPVLGAIAAHLVGAARERGLRPWVSASSRPRFFGPVVVLVWGTGVVAYMALVVLAWAAGLGVGWQGVDGAPLLYAVRIVTFLALATLLGATLGWSLPRWAAVAGAPVMLYAVYAVPGYLAGFDDSPLAEVARLIHPAERVGWAGAMPAPHLIGLLSACDVALAVLMWGRLTRSFPVRRAALVAVAALMAATWTTGHDRSFPRWSDPVCDATGRVCVSRSLHAAVPDFAASIAAVGRELPPFVIPPVIVSPELAETMEVPSSTLVFGPSSATTYPSRVVDQTATVSEALQVFVTHACGPAVQHGETWDDVDVYWRVLHGANVDGGNWPGQSAAVFHPDRDRALARARGIAAQPVEERRAWLREQLATLGCEE